MSDDYDDVAGGLLALGLIVLVGVGIYKVISSFGSFEDGDEVTNEELVRANHSQPRSIRNYNEGYGRVIERYQKGMSIYKTYEGDTCPNCGTESPERCGNGHCMNCVAELTDGDGKCYCGQCLKCYGHSGANECGSCSD